MPGIVCPKYCSRKVTCPVCSEQIETAQMQLFTPQGYRNINCSKCATQRRTKGWKCECGIAWHTCDVHRNDPTVHRSTKPQAAAKKSEELKETSFKDSDRKAPESVQSTTHRPQKKVRVSATLHTHDASEHMQEADIRSKNLLERIKTKFAERNDRPCDRESKGGSIESRKEPPETKKSKAEVVVYQCSNKKFKSDGQAQPDPQPIAMTRKRMRHELEERESTTCGSNKPGPKTMKVSTERRCEGRRNEKMTISPKQRTKLNHNFLAG